jgi:hypothetical protein
LLANDRRGPHLFASDQSYAARFVPAQRTGKAD